MTIKKSLKVLIVFIIVCIMTSIFSLKGISYYKLPYYHESGTSQYYNVNINGIYYNIDTDSKLCPAEVFYPFKNVDELKIPNKIKFKGKKYKVKEVTLMTDEEYFEDGNAILPSKLSLPYKTIHLPKYATSFNRVDVKLPNLKKLYVPKNTHELIGINDMPKLKVIIDKKNPYIKMKNGAVYSKDGKTMYCLVNSKKKYKIAKGTTFIDLRSNKTVEKVILPSSVTNLSSGAFDWCFKLKSVKLNEQLKIIENYAFEKCKSLKSITIPKNVEKIEYWAFKNCKKLSKVKLESEEKAPIIEDASFKNTKNGIKFIVKNQTVADQLKEQLKGSGVKNAKILVGKKVVYKNVK